MARAKDKKKPPLSQLITFMRDSYLDRTSRPIYAVAYLIPFIILYEIGTIMINPDVLNRSLSESQIRVMAFIWLQEFLRLLKFDERAAWMATPFVVIIILLAIQMTARRPWKVYFRDFVPMTIECIILAVPLIVLSLLFNRVGTATQNAAPLLAESWQETVTSTGATPLFVDIVTGIGAGIYEELIFRLILICLLMLLFQDLFGMRRGYAIGLSILISAVLFSAHHHFFFINGEFTLGEAFTVSRFLFRFMAGIYFAVIFALRGFGIVAGSHAFYDIIAALLNASLFDGQE